ncbi:SDR family NAD(P)-dependent oxidoreductase [Leifsonia naganoensis]|uniref:3-oxoacyl-[acyl-carrier protein] reductase n=1 Tax=Leifsonia naganoensis TaxID=150025 RepID=A0A853DJM0_9MICO|nr:SDR family oxidoreductase [Leifsonia naganoensis]NYK09276.1 3-oxoacyl-[acyl-carrier protein] reductase [Leifsonia naganoensis]
MGETTRAALITGGAGGIGAAIAERLRAQGAAVWIADRDEAAVCETARRLGAIPLVLDVSSPESLNDAAARLPETLDVLVASAAVAGGPGLSAETVRAVLDVNVAGVAAIVEAALPALRRSAAPRVLTIGSVQATRAGGGSPAYVASKGAVHALTRALAVDLALDGILVNALAPGFVDTAMALLPDGTSEYDTDWFQEVYVGHGGVPLRRPARPEEVAAAADFFLSPANTYVTGAVLAVDGGLTAAL